MRGISIILSNVEGDSILKTNVAEKKTKVVNYISSCLRDSKAAVIKAEDTTTVIIPYQMLKTSIIKIRDLDESS